MKKACCRILVKYGYLELDSALQDRISTVYLGNLPDLSAINTRVLVSFYNVCVLNLKYSFASLASGWVKDENFTALRRTDGLKNIIWFRTNKYKKVLITKVAGLCTNVCLKRIKTAIYVAGFEYLC
jgi:hypothetical protein